MAVSVDTLVTPTQDTRLLHAVSRGAKVAIGDLDGIVTDGAGKFTIAPSLLKMRKITALEGFGDAGGTIGFVRIRPSDLTASPPVFIVEKATASIDLTPQAKAFDPNGLIKPAIVLTHAADPTAGATDGPLFVVPDTGSLDAIAHLESVTKAGASVGFTTGADGGLYRADQRGRGWVKHAAAPGGVQIYVDEGDSDKLKCISPSALDLLVPIAVDGVPMFLKVIHVASVAGMKALYFNDDGADNAKLVYLDTGATGGVVHALNKVAGNLCAFGAVAHTGAPTGPVTALASTNLTGQLMHFTAYGK